MAMLYKVSSSNQHAFTFVLALNNCKRVHSTPVDNVGMVDSKAVRTSPSASNYNTSFISCSEGGFNLVELIVTVTILAIIAVIATPTVLTQLAHMEAKRIRYGMLNTLALAKAESLIRRKNLLVCLSDGNGRCDRDSNRALLLFMDNNSNQDFDADTDGLLVELTLSPRYGTLHLRAGNRDYVRFAGDSGKPRGFFGHIKYCPSSNYNQAMYQISFNQSGIIKYKPSSMHPTGC
ncbi:type IV fimbrial biogenesis protein FimT [Psychrobacter sp. PL19]|uniref:GspH/FimT family pseudopilin n=1 Tax=Psychrobacter sp. PL19 TaxID=2760711 RepID=UPI002FF11CDB